MHDFSNVGRFEMIGSFLRDTPDIVQDIYKTVIPTQVIYDGQSDVFHVTGISRKFRDVEEGARIPEYQIVCIEGPGGPYVKFKEIE